MGKNFPGFDSFPRKLFLKAKNLQMWRWEKTLQSLERVRGGVDFFDSLDEHDVTVCGFIGRRILAGLFSIWFRPGAFPAPIDHINDEFASLPN